MTPGARRVLEELAAGDDIDLAQEGMFAYCGNRPTTARVVNELLGLMAISVIYRDGFKTTFTTYGINDIGRAILRRPELEAELQEAIFARRSKPFQVVNDRIVLLEQGSTEQCKPKRASARKTGTSAGSRGKLPKI